MKAVVVLSMNTTQNTCVVDVSLDYAVDRWWYASKGQLSMQVTTQLPLYLALYMKSKIEEKVNCEAQIQWSEVDIHARIDDWISEAIQQVDDTWRTHIEKIWMKENQKECAITGGKWEVEEIHEDALRILPYIEGRRWLFEHLEKRLKMIGIRLQGYCYNERTRSYLQTLIQYLYRIGEIEITSGITIHDLIGRMEVQCERCGSIDYGIHLHYCSICEHDDLVCDTCYVMGVSKGCSLVISRPKNDSYSLKDDQATLLQEATSGYRRVLKWNGTL